MKTRKITCLALCLILILLPACAEKLTGPEVPSNWPEYRMKDLTLRWEAGWTEEEPADFEAEALEGFDALSITPKAAWIGVLASPSGSTRERNYLTVSRFAAGEKVTPELLEQYKSQLGDLKVAFLQAGVGVAVVDEPQVEKIWDMPVLTFSCRMTMADETKVLVQTAIVGRDEMIYQIHFMDYLSNSSDGSIRLLVSGLKWPE
ncbi:MAG: hypothetical protein IJM90_05940 [Firmicutes bacterium]|nr:hypothetical protein [Bacillota bacterium]